MFRFVTRFAKPYNIKRFGIVGVMRLYVFC